MQQWCTDKKAQRFFWPILIFGVAVAAMLTLWLAAQQSLWFDENYSIEIARRSWSEMLHLTALDTHPPLYYIFLKVWMSWFGDGALAVRSLSVLFFAGSLVMAGVLLRRLFGARIALLSLPILIFSPLLVRYGFEARPYAMASFIGTLATYVLVRATERTKQKTSHGWWWAAYGALVALGTLTLYYTVFLWIGHLAWLVVHMKQRSLKNIVRAPWFLAYIGACIGFSPWLMTFISQFSNGALAPIGQAMTLENLLSIVTFNVLYQPVWQLDAVWTIAALAAFFIVIYTTISAHKTLRLTAQFRGYTLLIFSFITPVLLLTIIGFIKPMYVERYLSHVAIFGMMMVVVSIIVAPKTPRACLMYGSFLALTLLGCWHLSVVGNYNFQRLQRPNMNEVASVVQEKSAANAVVLANDPYVMTELAYYQRGAAAAKLYFLSDKGELSGGYAPWNNRENRLTDAKQLVQKTDAQQIFYVYYGDAPAVDLAHYGFALKEKQEYSPLTIATYER